jgi:hypothetical protein
MRFIAHICDMREPTNTPRSVFSLRTSTFNNFLYAPVGGEDNGMASGRRSSASIKGLTTGQSQHLKE